MGRPEAGPLCECDRAACMARLPADAWNIVARRTLNGGDRPLVVAPGHRSRGDRLLERRHGYHVLEESEPR